jgi:hypothetical protein
MVLMQQVRFGFGHRLSLTTFGKTFSLGVDGVRPLRRRQLSNRQHDWHITFYGADAAGNLVHWIDAKMMMMMIWPSAGITLQQLIFLLFCCL